MESFVGSVAVVSLGGRKRGIEQLFNSPETGGRRTNKTSMSEFELYGVSVSKFNSISILLYHLFRGVVTHVTYV